MPHTTDQQRHDAIATAVNKCVARGLCIFDSPNSMIEFLDLEEVMRLAPGGAAGAVAALERTRRREERAERKWRAQLLKTRDGSEMISFVAEGEEKTSTAAARGGETHHSDSGDDTDDDDATTWWQPYFIPSSLAKLQTNPSAEGGGGASGEHVLTPDGLVATTLPYCYLTTDTQRRLGVNVPSHGNDDVGGSHPAIPSAGPSRTSGSGGGGVGSAVTSAAAAILYAPIFLATGILSLSYAVAKTVGGYIVWPLSWSVERSAEWSSWVRGGYDASAAGDGSANGDGGRGVVIIDADGINSLYPRPPRRGSRRGGDKANRKQKKARPSAQENFGAINERLADPSSTHGGGSVRYGGVVPVSSSSNNPAVGSSAPAAAPSSPNPNVKQQESSSSSPHNDGVVAVVGSHRRPPLFLTNGSLRGLPTSASGGGSANGIVALFGGGTQRRRRSKKKPSPPASGAYADAEVYGVIGTAPQSVGPASGGAGTTTLAPHYIPASTRKSRGRTESPANVENSASSDGGSSSSGDYESSYSDDDDDDDVANASFASSIISTAAKMVTDALVMLSPSDDSGTSPPTDAAGDSNPSHPNNRVIFLPAMQLLTAKVLAHLNGEEDTFEDTIPLSADERAAVGAEAKLPLLPPQEEDGAGETAVGEKVEAAMNTAPPALSASHPPPPPRPNNPFANPYKRVFTCDEWIDLLLALNIRSGEAITEHLILTENLVPLEVDMVTAVHEKEEVVGPEEGPAAPAATTLRKLRALYFPLSKMRGGGAIAGDIATESAKEKVTSPAEESVADAKALAAWKYLSEGLTTQVAYWEDALSQQQLLMASLKATERQILKEIRFLETGVEERSDEEENATIANEDYDEDYDDCTTTTTSVKTKSPERHRFCSKKHMSDRKHIKQLKARVGDIHAEQRALSEAMNVVADRISRNKLPAIECEKLRGRLEGILTTTDGTHKSTGPTPSPEEKEGERREADGNSTPTYISPPLPPPIHIPTLAEVVRRIDEMMEHFGEGPWPQL